MVSRDIVALNCDETHKTVQSINAGKGFVVHIADAKHIVEGVVWRRQRKQRTRKVCKVGFVDVPIINEIPIAMFFSRAYSPTVSRPSKNLTPRSILSINSATSWDRASSPVPSFWSSVRTLPHPRVSYLSEESRNIANMIIMQLRDTWPRVYGVELIGIAYSNFALTEESMETYKNLEKRRWSRRFPNSLHSRKHQPHLPHGSALIAARRTQANFAPTAAQSMGNKLLLKCAKEKLAVVPDKTEQNPHSRFGKMYSE